MKGRAVAEGLDESGGRHQRTKVGRIRKAGMGLVAVPVAVSVFTAAPASAGAVVEYNPRPTDISSTQAGFVLPWLVGIEGIGGSKGTVGGWAWAHSGPTGTQAGVKGVLQQTTHLGPAYFNLDVTKSAVFTYTPPTTTTTTTPGGHGPCDHDGHPTTTTTTTGAKAELNLVDIGNWSVGIPGFVEWYGQLGFTSDTVVDENGVSFNWKGVNKQYVSIGGGLLVFGFDFQPSFGFNVPTPGVNLADSLAPVLAPGSTPVAAKTGDAGAKPGEDGAKTGHDGAKPGDVVDTASYAGAKPGQGEGSLGEGGVTPGQDGVTPDAQGAKPGAEGGVAPGAEGGTPGAEGGVTPGGKPGAESGVTPGGKPGAEGGKPGAEGGKPGAEGGKPGAEGGKPGAEGGKPGAEGGNNGQPRNGKKPGQNNRDKSGPDGSKPGPGGDKSNQGGDKSGADAK